MKMINHSCSHSFDSPLCGAVSKPLNIAFLTERSGGQESIILTLLAKYGLAALNSSLWSSVPTFAGMITQIGF